MILKRIALFALVMLIICISLFAAAPSASACDQQQIRFISSGYCPPAIQYQVAPVVYQTAPPVPVVYLQQEVIEVRQQKFIEVKQPRKQVIRSRQVIRSH